MNIFLPKLKPVAPDTWELRAALLATDQETGRVEITMPGRCVVSGAYCSVIDDSSNGLLTPGLEDILALVDLDNQRRFTSGPSQGQTSASGRGSQYVTLAALDSRVRDLYWDLQSPRPVIGMTFRWKRFVSGTPLYEDAQISVALMIVPDMPPGA
jgi:hypothetical protein